VPKSKSRAFNGGVGAASVPATGEHPEIQLGFVLRALAGI
jgi:hypothetical protein